MTTNADQLATQSDLELALISGEISLAELEARSAALGLPVADYLREPGQSTARQPITITAEMLVERDRLDQMLKLGKITLVDALDLCMALGVPGTNYMRDLFAKAVADYQAGKYEDLAVPFGISARKTDKNREKRHTRDSNIRFHVDAAAASGLPKIDPSQYPGTAFEAAGELLDLSPSHVYDRYYSRKK